MKRTPLASLVLASALLACTAASAGLIENFEFNDADGTALDAAANSASTHQWIHDTDHVSTIQVQDGSLNIIKNNSDFVTEGLEFEDVSSGVLWMVAEFANYAVLGSAPDGSNVEEIRFGFMGTADVIPPPSSTIVAEMMIARNHEAGTFQITGAAGGTGASNIAAATIDFVQPEPFTMAMKVDQDLDEYTIWYKDGAAPYTLVGKGDMDPARNALVVRFTVNNFWGDEDGEVANLDRFYISDTAPEGIPEPSVLMLSFLAMLIGLLVRARVG